jgi:hypothetical protein
MHVPKEKRTKWDAHTIEGVLVGYSETHKGYRILHKDSSKVTVSRTVTFDEGTVTEQRFTMVTGTGQPSSASKGCELVPSHSGPDNSIDLQHKVINSNERQVQVDVVDDNGTKIQQHQTIDTKAEPVIRKSTRCNKGVPAIRLSYMVRTAPQKEPESWKEMQKLPVHEKQKWLEAANEEMNSLMGLQAWELTELPEGRRAIGCKWVFKTKYDSEGKAYRHKARLVAKGYSQKYGDDYDATFAPVAKQTTFRTLLAIAAVRKMKVHHFDVKTAFLNGEIEENLFMSQPEGYISEGNEHLVCKLKRSIYGLKQSARAWNTKINDIMLKEGFARSKADQCLYTKFKDNKWMYVLVYVDDLIVVHVDDEVIAEFGEILNQNFQTNDLGYVTYYLGIQIERQDDGSFLLSQSAKIEAIIQQFGMSDAKGASIPMAAAYLKSNGEQEVLPNNEQYRQAVGALLYIATTTRPDIATAIGILCRSVDKPCQRDWKAVKDILRYLKQSVHLKLKMSADNKTDLIGYVDADWAGDTVDRKSTSGYLFQIGDSSVSWSSRKQMSVALSSTEAEYVAAAYASQEAVWLRQLLNDLGEPAVEATRIYEDNQGCIKLATSERINARTKHIDIRHHHLRDLAENGIIELIYCETDKMIADAMTKPLPAPRFKELRTKMGMI